MREKLLKNQEDLFEFLCNRINVQINKYKALMSVDIRPDARFNANLVFEEVCDLLQLSEQLLDGITALAQKKFFDTSDITFNYYYKNFASIFEQTRFYLEQEELRAKAAWLIDPNSIQENLKNRINKQVGQLSEIAKASGFDTSLAAQPTTTFQIQFQFDSHCIASKILNLALTYRNFPQERPSDVADANHAIYQKHAGTRYVKFSEQISKLNDECTSFLSGPRGSRSKDVDPVELRSKISRGLRSHLDNLENLVGRYKILKPTFALFTLEETQTIGVPPGTVSGKHGHFGKAAQTDQNPDLFQSAQTPQSKL